MCIESSGTKAFMNGPSLCKLCKTDRNIDRSLKMNFKRFFPLPVYYLGKIFKGHLEYY